MTILSILICSLSWRIDELASLLKILQPQMEEAGHEFVELLVYTDTKGKTTGEKRNTLLNQAKGKYVVFIDDDDWVPDYYVKEMLIACTQEPDCVAINGYITTDGKDKIRWKLSKDYENITVSEKGELVYLRKTNHITAVLREHALKAMFPDKSNAEDKGYSEKLNQFLKTEIYIEPDMYHYKYSSINKEYQ
jgi:glycosyltransferase involved in cell wall biosynthesis